MSGESGDCMWPRGSSANPGRTAVQSGRSGVGSMRMLIGRGDWCPQPVGGQPRQRPFADDLVVGIADDQRPVRRIEADGDGLPGRLRADPDVVLPPPQLALAVDLTADGG